MTIMDGVPLLEGTMIDRQKLKKKGEAYKKLEARGYGAKFIVHGVPPTKAQPGEASPRLPGVKASICCGRREKRQLRYCL